MTRLAVVLICVAAAGCATAPAETATPAKAATPPAQPRAVVLGEGTTLAPGDAMSAKDAGLTVRFLRVIEDSRCPVDATCVWQGEVKMLLEVQPASKAASQVELSTLNRFTMAGDFRIVVLQVYPPALSGKPIAPQDYRATLSIDRHEAPDGIQR